MVKLRNNSWKPYVYIVFTTKFYPECWYKKKKLEKKYSPALDNYGRSCFVRSYFLKMKCVCKTQMMPPPVDIHTSIMCISILQNIKAVAIKL